MDLVTLTTIIAAFSGIFLSVVSILYTKQQNKRRIEVNIKVDLSRFKRFEEICYIEIELSAFNSGFRSVALINYEFLVNGKIIDFTFYDSYKDPSKENGYILISPINNDKLPHALKEGEMTVSRINAAELAQALKNKRVNKKRLNGKIQLSGYFETAQNKKIYSKPIEFNIDTWEECFKQMF
jgi:hypothetical protein